MITNDLPLVSLCILCYNHEKFVIRAIESCLNQTYGNCEVLIVDNGSADGSAQVIESYCKDNESIHFYPLKVNSYPSNGLNYLVERSNGEYIALTSADDFFEKDKVQRQLDCMLTDDLSNCFTWVNVVDDAGDVIHDHDMSGLFNREFPDNTLQEFFVSHGNTLCAPSAMLHRRIFEKYGFFDSRLLQLQDYDFWLRIIKSESINVLPEKLSNYCVRSDAGNLSLGLDSSVFIRSQYESFYTVRHILDFDLEVLSTVVGKSCSPISKFSNLFHYYHGSGQLALASGILHHLYLALGSKFEFPSELYSDFNRLYSNFDLLNESQIKALKMQLTLKDTAIHQKNLLIQDRDSQVQRLTMLMESMRIKNRLKRIFRIFKL